jgi:hypothetical protein
VSAIWLLGLFLGKASGRSLLVVADSGKFLLLL